jgi:uncharacterized membrane protein
MTVFDKGFFTILALSAVMFLVALPLALRKVRPNVVYGYRTRATLADEDLWYEANAYFGSRLIIASVCGAAAGWALYVTRPLPPEVFLPVSVLVLAAPTLVAALATSRFVRALSGSRG